MTEATPSVRPIIENTGATATAAAETLMKTIAMDGNRINIPIDVRQVAERLGLEVQYLLLDSGTDGMIVKEAGRPCKVVVDARVRNAQPIKQVIAALLLREALFKVFRSSFKYRFANVHFHHPARIARSTTVTSF